MALLGCRQGRRPRRIDFVAVSLPEMLRVKRCWVASELDVATVRDDHYAVVVDLETMLCLPRAGNQHHKAAKHSHLRMRNPVCREAFQQDLEKIQVGTAGIHVDEHHAVCMRAIQDLAQKRFERQQHGPRKHCAYFADLDPYGLCQGPPQGEEKGV